MVPSQQNVWVDAVREGQGLADRERTERYQVQGLLGPQANHLLYGIGTPMTLQKQNFQGTKDAYIFDVQDLAVRQGQLDELRPLVPHAGRDGQRHGHGHVRAERPGPDHHEQRDVQPRAPGPGSPGPAHGFPTYPATFLTENGQLFFTGSNAGLRAGHAGLAHARVLGPEDRHVPPGAGHPGPAGPGDQRLGAAAARPEADVHGPRRRRRRPVELVHRPDRADRRRRARTRTGCAARTWPRPTRYPITVLLPDDEVLVTGGSQYYRGMHGSDNRDTRIYNVATNSFSWAADSITGRDYHSGGILLPNGSVLTLGGNPLFGNQQDTAPQTFNQEIDVYYPPYMFRAPGRASRPRPRCCGRQHSYLIKVSQPSQHQVPAADAAGQPHPRDRRQRALGRGQLHPGRPRRAPDHPAGRTPNLLPPSYYMLFAVNASGIPSAGYWVQVP